MPVTGGLLRIVRKFVVVVVDSVFGVLFGVLFVKELVRLFGVVFVFVLVLGLGVLFIGAESFEELPMLTLPFDRLPFGKLRAGRVGRAR